MRKLSNCGKGVEQFWFASPAEQFSPRNSGVKGTLGIISWFGCSNKFQQNASQWIFFQQEKFVHWTCVLTNSQQWKSYFPIWVWWFSSMGELDVFDQFLVTVVRKFSCEALKAYIRNLSHLDSTTPAPRHVPVSQIFVPESPNITLLGGTALQDQSEEQHFVRNWLLNLT